MALLAALVGAHQVLPSVLDPFHRPAEPQRRHQNQNILGIYFPANAETAPDVAFMHMQRRWAALQHPAQSFLVPVRYLGGAVKLQYVARRIVAAERSTRFHRNTGMPPCGEVQFDDGMRVLERGFDIAVAVVEDSGFGAAAGFKFAWRIARRQQNR